MRLGGPTAEETSAGGNSPENPARSSGKSWGTICIDGVLYSWIVPDIPDTGGPRDHYRYIELAKSIDHGAHWTKANWRWWREDDLIIPTFLLEGKNQGLSRGGYAPGTVWQLLGLGQ